MRKTTQDAVSSLGEQSSSVVWYVCAGMVSIYLSSQLVFINSMQS